MFIRIYIINDLGFLRTNGGIQTSEVRISGVAKGRGSWQNHALWTAFLAGAAVAIAPLAGQGWLEDTLQLGQLSPALDAAGTALLVAAVPEETAKFLVVIAIAGRWRDARRLQDIIVLALGAALGFAFVENEEVECGNYC